MKQIITTIIFALLTLTLSAQSSRAIRKADAWFDLKEFKQAEIDYEKLIKSAEKNRNATLETKSYLYTRLGETYLNLREYIKAEKNFDKAVENGAISDLNFLLNHGRVLEANNDTLRALEMFRKALAVNNESEEAKNAILNAQFNISSSTDPRARQNPVTLETKLNIATNQYALAWYKGSLLFSCDRTSPIGDGKTIAPSSFFTSRPFLDFENDDISGWTTPQRIYKIEDDPLYFVHSFAYDNNSSISYVMRCLVKANALDNRCNIFAYYENASGKMSRPMQQSFHTRDANIGHPTLSSDGNVMIFTSTKNETSNLYIVKKISPDTWTEPMRLSSVINTTGNEAYPQIYQDSLLFFSSNGHLGMGGMDIFFTKITVNGKGHTLSGSSNLEKLEFSEPINMGYPINSGADDVSILFKANTLTGFFISNRAVNGQNRNQIYSFENEPYVFEQHGISSTTRTLAQQPAKTVEFVMPRKVDTERSKLNEKIAKLNEEVFGLNSEWTKNNSEIVRLNEERLIMPDNTETLIRQDQLYARNNALLAEITKQNNDIAKQNAELAKIKPNPNDERARLDDEMAKENSKITQQNNSITKANAEFSETNRQDEDELIAQQRTFIERNLGFIQNFFAYNDRIDELNDEIDRLTAGRNNRIDTVFVDRIVEVERIVEKRVEVPVEVLIEKATTGEVLVLENIFFGNNSTVLESRSMEVLNRLVAAMKANPNTRIEISGHTDVIGTISHNQQLSEGRAKAVRDHLILNGICQSRLEYVGHSFKKPIANNQTPEGRAKNRRVEIKVL